MSNPDPTRYNDYYRTGIQDCDNVMDPDEFVHEPGDPEDVVERVWRRLEREGLREDWLSQNREDIEHEGLSPERCYLEWARGWKVCAARHVAHYRREHKIDYYVYDETDEVVGTRDDFVTAVELAVSAVMRRGGPDAVSIMLGDDYGPSETIARVETAGVAEVRVRHTDFDAVLTIDRPRMVPHKMLRAGLDRSVISVQYRPGKSHPVLVQLNELAKVPPEVVEDDTQQRYAMLEFDRGPRSRASTELEDDDTAKRFAAMDLPDDLNYNPALTKKGVKLYQQVLAAARLQAETQRRAAPQKAARAVVRAAQRGVPGIVRKNPVAIGAGREPAEIFQEDADAAVDKYKEFHRYDANHVEEIRGLAIPHRVRNLGAAKYVLYRSGKVDPATLRKPRHPVDYIHEHDAGVTVYVTDGAADTDVPRDVRETTALVKLGKCLGFALRDGTEAEGTAPLPDLCCTPDGKCLLIVQDKKKVLAMFWGGALGVFARGIDG